jgi:hypothetical protein
MATDITHRLSKSAKEMLEAALPQMQVELEIRE